ncbi:MAG: glycosyltransferase, partial [ANME-2 cluster archaeon]|nr:glycosyltransferase [ANME-2 cluster archaeon]
MKTYKSYLPQVSIIVCTYNRVAYLKKCLDSLQKLNYPNYEIIVVNGPSTDKTDDLLSDYCDIKNLNQPKLNGLSVARNIGIKASSGEIIAFIDDDAVADANWLTCLAEEYKDESVGGVGGLVYDITGSWLQFKNGFINKCGIPTFIVDNAPNFNDKGGYNFNYIMGTNSSFRKSTLVKVGCFDKNIKYYADEAELCVRIIKSGEKIIHTSKAKVFHGMVEGHNRKSPYDLNWSEIMKNVIYFTLKNFRGDFSSYTFRPTKSLYWWLKYFIHPYFNKDISLKQLFDIYLKLVIGAMNGYISGLKVSVNKNNSILVNIPTFNRDDKLKICLLSQEFSKNCNGGVCRYTYDLAHALAELGNEVHVVTHSKKDHEYEYRTENVYVHAIIPQSIDFLGLSNDM